MESVSWAVLSIVVALATPPKCSEALAVVIPTTWPSLAGHSTSTCASLNAGPKKIHTSSAPVPATITSTRLKGNAVSRKPKPLCAKSMARRLPAYPNTFQPSGPTVTLSNRKKAASSSNGFMKSILHEDLDSLPMDWRNKHPPPTELFKAVHGRTLDLGMKL